jgi:ABC-2 type transport system permease protein
MHAIKQIMIKEFRQIRRDRAMLAIIFVMPVVQLVILGYVISSQVKHIDTMIIDQDNSAMSRAIRQNVDQSVYFDLVQVSDRYRDGAPAIDRGEVKIALVLPHDMAQKISQGDKVRIQILVDGQDSNTSTIGLGYLNGLLVDTFKAIFPAGVHPKALPLELMPVRIDTEMRNWYNPNLDYSDYMIPGIAAFLLTIVTSLLSAMGLVREREIGTLEQLSVTPIRKHQLLIGKIIPFAILGFIELAVALAFAKLWYDIPMRGNLGILAIFSMVYLITTLGIGLLVSASAKTQQQALFMTWFFMVYALLMSGFIFPIENMPRFAQWISYLNPLRYFMVVIREIFIKDATVVHLYQQGIILLIFGAVIFTFATMKFQQRMS